MLDALLLPDEHGNARARRQLDRRLVPLAEPQEAGAGARVGVELQGFPVVGHARPVVLVRPGVSPGFISLGIVFLGVVSLGFVPLRPCAAPGFVPLRPCAAPGFVRRRLDATLVRTPAALLRFERLRFFFVRFRIPGILLVPRGRIREVEVGRPAMVVPAQQQAPRIVRGRDQRGGEGLSRPGRLAGQRDASDHAAVPHGAGFVVPGFGLALLRLGLAVFAPVLVVPHAGAGIALRTGFAGIALRIGFVGIGFAGFVAVRGGPQLERPVRAATRQPERVGGRRGIRRLAAARRRAVERADAQPRHDLDLADADRRAGRGPAAREQLPVGRISGAEPRLEGDRDRAQVQGEFGADDVRRRGIRAVLTGPGGRRNQQACAESERRQNGSHFDCHDRYSRGRPRSGPPRQVSSASRPKPRRPASSRSSSSRRRARRS